MHKILVIIAYAQMSIINVNVDVSSEARGLNFGLRLYLHPYLMYAGREDLSLGICAD